MKKYILIAIIPFIALIVSQTKWPIKGGYGALSDVTGPGTVPLGGMIAIMKSIPSAWQPGTTGVEKDGFQLADGAAFDGDCTLTGNTPNMASAFLRGNTATSGTAGGANSYDASGLSSSVPAHYHTEGSNGSSLTGAAHGHTITFTSPQAAFNIGTTKTAGVFEPGTQVSWANLTESVSGGSHGVSGTVGHLDGAINGDGSFAASVSGTVPTEPPYIETVWVIRCK